MKILVCQTSLSSQYIVDACEIINKKNKDIKFGFIFGARKGKSEKEKNNLLNINNKIINNKINSKIYFLREDSDEKNIDLKYLKNYEEKIAKNNIWKMVSADRFYGRSYITDISGYDSPFTSKNSNKILSNFFAIAKKIEKIFREFKPNVIFIPNGLSSLDISILESVAIYFNVKILTPEPYRFKNYFFFSNNLISKNLNIKKNYFNTKKKYKSSIEIDKIYKEIINKKNSISADADKTRNTLFKINKKNIFQKILGNLIYITLKHSYFYLLHSLGFRNNHLRFLPKYNLFQNIFLEIKTKKTFNYLLNLKSPNLDRKYIYYPLHVIPETSTLLKGNDYMNQEYLIESISKNIPSNCKLYIKEHPAMLVSHPRKISFFEKIKKLPNVELLNPKEDSRKIISKAQAVIVVDGSSGFEAMISRIPLVTMKQYNYDFLDLSVTNYNIEGLFLDIQSAIKKNFTVTKKEFELKIKILLKSIIDNSYKLRDPDTFYYFTRGITTSKEIKITSEDLAFALIKELKLKN